VGAIYTGLDARGFQMNARGRMHWAARWLLAPCRAGAALNAWGWTRALPASSEVAPGLRLGRRPTRAEWQAAGQPRVLCLCAELQTAPLPGARCVPLLDLALPSTARLRRAITLLQAMRADGAPVWVCCALGFSRSAATVTGWLALHGHAPSMAAARDIVQRARPQIVLHDDWMARLEPLHDPH
jgi:hypothetical protein